MKITDVKALPLWAGRRNLFVLKMDFQAGFYRPQSEDAATLWDTWAVFHEGTFYLYYLATSRTALHAEKDLALLRHASASSTSSKGQEADKCAPEKAFDGQYWTYWQADADESDARIQVDLGSVKDIGRVGLRIPIPGPVVSPTAYLRPAFPVKAPELCPCFRLFQARIEIVSVRISQERVDPNLFGGIDGFRSPLPGLEDTPASHLGPLPLVELPDLGIRRPDTRVECPFVFGKRPHPVMAPRVAPPPIPSAPPNQLPGAFEFLKSVAAFQRQTGVSQWGFSLCRSHVIRHETRRQQDQESNTMRYESLFPHRLIR